MVLDMVMGDPEDSEMGILGIAFKNYISQASKGQLEIQLAYSGGLDADEAYQFHRVQTGKIDMALGGIGNLVPMVRNLGVVTLPYLFPDQNAVVRGTTGKAAMLLDSYAEKAGLKILAWTYYGYRYISNSRRPIKSLEDMRGLKFRVPQSLEMIRTYRAFGGIPMPLAWPMTRSALKNNLVDGQCYGYIGFKAMKFNEAKQKYLTEVHYTYQLQPLVMSERVYKKMKPELQAIMVKGGIYAQEQVLQYQKEEAQAAKDALIAAGLVVDQLEDEDEWKKAALEKVWPEMADQVGGKDTINNYLKAMGKQPWEPKK